MNSTQKSGVTSLFGALLGFVAFAYVGSIITFGRMPPKPLGHIIVASTAVAALVFVVLSMWLVAKRQSQAEPEADERDKAIRARAAILSYVATGLTLVTIVGVLGLTLGQDGSIPVYLLTVILLGVGVVAMLVYGTAILVQYGRGGKDE
jgi:hypothetical protein